VVGKLVCKGVVISGGVSGGLRDLLVPHGGLVLVVLRGAFTGLPAPHGDREASGGASGGCNYLPVPHGE
jgi:hypothetical protein